MANTTSKSKQSYYSNYKASSRWKTNRLRKLNKLLKEQPNNKDIKRAIDNIVYRRKTPNTTIWNSSNIRVAKLIKEFSGKCPHGIFSSNPKTASEHLQTTWRSIPVHELPQGKVSFSLETRSHGVGN
jgi:hypothetical protein